MLVSLGVPEDYVARWTSVCIAMLSGLLCSSAIIWGLLADRFGRKPMIIIAISMHMVFTMLLGLSGSKYVIVLSMSCLGIACGNIGTLRYVQKMSLPQIIMLLSWTSTIITELVPDPKMQPRAYSILPLVFDPRREIEAYF